MQAESSEKKFFSKYITYIDKLRALLLCTGFVATQPFSVMAEEIVTAVQTVQQQKQSVSLHSPFWWKRWIASNPLFL